MIDDHLIDSMRRWFNDAYKELKMEWQSNEYERLIDCPSFKAAYTYKEALDVLIKGPERVDESKVERLKILIEEDLELENHWKNK